MTLGVSFTKTGMLVCCLHQRATISMYSGTWPTAEPMPRSDMPCGQPKLSSTPSQLVSSTAGQDRLPALLVAGDHEGDDDGAVGEEALDAFDLLQVDLERAVGDQLDIVEAGHAGAAYWTAP